MKKQTENQCTASGTIALLSNWPKRLVALSFLILWMLGMQISGFAQAAFESSQKMPAPLQSALTDTLTVKPGDEVNYKISDRLPTLLHGIAAAWASNYTFSQRSNAPDAINLPKGLIYNKGNNAISGVVSNDPNTPGSYYSSFVYFCTNDPTKGRLYVYVNIIVENNTPRSIIHHTSISTRATPAQGGINVLVDDKLTVTCGDSVYFDITSRFKGLFPSSGIKTANTELPKGLNCNEPTGVISGVVSSDAETNDPGDDSPIYRGTFIANALNYGNNIIDYQESLSICINKQPLDAPWERIDKGGNTGNDFVDLTSDAVQMSSWLTVAVPGAFNEEQNQHYRYQEWNGNGSFIVQVSGVDGEAGSAVGGGLMVWQQPNASGGPLYAAVEYAKTASNGRTIRSIGTPSIQPTAYQSQSLPQATQPWVRLDKVGAFVHSYYSLDGVKWTYCKSVRLGIKDKFYVGMYVSNPTTSPQTYTFNNIMFDPISIGSPDAWQRKDIGLTKNAWETQPIPGYHIHTGSEFDKANGLDFEVASRGKSIGGTSDSLRFVHQPVIGRNGTILAKIESVDSASASTVAGVMIRDSNGKGGFSPGDCFAMVAFPGDQNGKIRFKYRTKNNAPVIEAPATYDTSYKWIKIARTTVTDGEKIQAWCSKDKQNWVSFGNATITPTPTGALCKGVALTSGDNSKIATATFSNVELWHAVVINRNLLEKAHQLAIDKITNDLINSSLNPVFRARKLISPDDKVPLGVPDLNVDPLNVFGNYTSKAFKFSWSSTLTLPSASYPVSPVGGAGFSTPLYSASYGSLLCEVLSRPIYGKFILNGNLKADGGWVSSVDQSGNLIHSGRLSAHGGIGLGGQLTAVILGGEPEWIAEEGSGASKKTLYRYKDVRLVLRVVFQLGLDFAGTMSSEDTQFITALTPSFKVTASLEGGYYTMWRDINGEEEFDSGINLYADLDCQPIINASSLMLDKREGESLKTKFNYGSGNIVLSGNGGIRLRFGSFYDYDISLFSFNESWKIWDGH